MPARQATTTEIYYQVSIRKNAQIHELTQFPATMTEKNRTPNDLKAPQRQRTDAPE